MNEPDNATRAAILAEILEMTQGETLRDDEITVAQFVESSGMTRRAATEKLNALVITGKLQMRKLLIDGVWCNAYRKT